MSVFGFGKKDGGSPVDGGTVVKRMSSAPGDFEGMDEERPRDLWMMEGVQNTMRGVSVNERLVPCRDGVKALRVRIRKAKARVWYLRPHPFAISFAAADGGRVRVTARLKPAGGSEWFAAWLDENAAEPGAEVTADGFGRLFDGRVERGGELPSWLEVIERRDEEEEPPEPEPEAEKTDGDPFEPGREIPGGYRIERELGKGGMGRVVLAVNEGAWIESRRKVVLKVLPAVESGDERAMKRLRNEANTLAELRNDNIAACFGIFAVGERYALAMEYVDGVSLDRYLEERGRISEEEAVELLSPVAEALDYCHARGIFHLDVKPQNVIVRTTPKNGARTCLVDFGISRGSGAGGETRSLYGTVQYMAPESITRSAPCAAMDVYSLAVTAYECVAGAMPYPDGWRIDAAPEPLDSVSEFAASVMRGLSARPDRRPASCVELICAADDEDGGLGASRPTNAPMVGRVAPNAPSVSRITPSRAVAGLRLAKAADGATVAKWDWPDGVDLCLYAVADGPGDAPESATFAVSRATYSVWNGVRLAGAHGASSRVVVCAASREGARIVRDGPEASVPLAPVAVTYSVERGGWGRRRAAELVAESSSGPLPPLEVRAAKTRAALLSRAKARLVANIGGGGEPSQRIALGGVARGESVRLFLADPGKGNFTIVHPSECEV